MREHVSLATIVLAAALPACGPSINTAAKADVDRQIAALQAANKTFAAPSGFVPMPMAVGQWTKHKMMDDKGQPSLLTYKLVGEEAGAFWMEMVNESYTGRTVTKMLVAFGDRANPATFEVRAMKTKDAEGKVSEMPPQMLSLMKSMWQPALSTLVINWQGLPQEDVGVTAGQFAGCFKARTDASWGPYKSASLSWSHQSVPLNGLVKSQGIDKPYSMELIDFGTEGASSEL